MDGWEKQTKVDEQMEINREIGDKSDINQR
jgi:hypothetical protein